MNEVVYRSTPVTRRADPGCPFRGSFSVHLRRGLKLPPVQGEGVSTCGSSVAVFGGSWEFTADYESLTVRDRRGMQVVTLALDEVEEIPGSFRRQLIPERIGVTSAGGSGQEGKKP